MNLYINNNQTEIEFYIKSEINYLLLVIVMVLLNRI